MNDNKRQARIAGLLYLLVAITAPFGLMVVPAKLIVAGDAAATASLIAGHVGTLADAAAAKLKMLGSRSISACACSCTSWRATSSACRPPA